MTNSIFAEPSAHRVEDIEASLTRLSDDSCCLTLKLKGAGRAGEFEIYGSNAIADKLQMIANAINTAFDHQPEDLVKLHNEIMTHLYRTDSWRNEA